MKKSILFSIWACMFIVCAVLGFIPEATGMARIAFTLLGIVFFLPPALLLRQADPATSRLIRNLSALSLGITVLTLVLSILSATGSRWLGDFFHAVLTVVSSPMMCCGYWALSLFLWACLLLASAQQCKNKTGA